MFFEPWLRTCAGRLRGWTDTVPSKVTYLLRAANLHVRLFNVARMIARKIPTSAPLVGLHEVLGASNECSSIYILYESSED